jgi:hypothetical protein
LPAPVYLEQHSLELVAVLQKESFKAGERATVIVEWAGQAALTDCFREKSAVAVASAVRPGVSNQAKGQRCDGSHEPRKWSILIPVGD